MERAKGAPPERLPLSDHARRAASGLLEPAARLLARAGLSPNALTLAGALLHVVVAFWVADGRLRLGALALAMAGLLDVLDGSLARATGRATDFGAFLDSVMDRVSESLLFLGVLAFALAQGLALEAALALVALSGSLLVSYTRARGASIGVDTRAGLFDRFLRVLIMILALASGWLLAGLLLVALGSWATTVQRIWDVRQRCRGAARDR